MILDILQQLHPNIPVKDIRNFDYNILIDAISDSKFFIQRAFLFFMKCKNMDLNDTMIDEHTLELNVNFTIKIKLKWMKFLACSLIAIWMKLFRQIAIG